MARIRMTESPPVQLEPEDFAQADRDLGQQGLAGSLLYAGIWLLVMTTTPVATDLSSLAWIGLVLLTLPGLGRLAFGLMFDPLHASHPRGWRLGYYAFVLVQAAVWGGLTAYLIWHYRTAWPAMLTSFATAGIVAGGTVSLITHQPLQRAYILTSLTPSALTGWATGDSGAMVMGFLFAANIAFLLTAGHKLSQGYWVKLRSNRLLKRRAAELEDAREKAESGVRAKSQFVAKVSHELRTPLNGLISTISMMQRTDSPTKREKFLDIMSKSANLLLRRINEILDFSKMEAGKLELELLSMDPALVVHDAVSLMRESAVAKGLRLDIAGPRGPAIQVVGDPTRLNQVLLNLISNAIKFTPVGRIVVGFRQQADGNGQVRCEFSVTDPGIGISPEAQTRIFESFEQADGSTTRQYGGTGLGLAVSRDLMRLMGGDIRCSSKEGEGSCFTFSISLPEAMDDDTPGNPIDAPQQPLEPPVLGLHVLVAEDNPVNQVIADEMLATLSCTCRVVDDGLACVEHFASSSFDAILMDCEMPGMDGYEASRRIRALESSSGLSPIPIVAVTAHADERNRRKALEAGMSDFVTKPFRLEELATALTAQTPMKQRQVAANIRTF